MRTLREFPAVDRVLTNAGAGDWSERAARLSELRRRSRPEIEVLVGGGLDAARIARLRAETDLREFHIGSAARDAAGRVRRERVAAVAAAAHRL